ncbi:MAG TPA: uracil-DNA glycosylase [Xanthomonadaceae bacterium]|nr:uracil-DNA glycosylase [Xanthomonadaceae bacterium]
MALDPDLRTRFRQLAAQTDGIDTEAYARFGKDPLEPIVGLGRRSARVAFFGRDPGRTEVEQGEPFVGSGGRIVRKLLYRHLHGTPMPDDAAAARAVGKPFFWINTVPYKPVGNKAWSMQVKRRFHPLMRRLLVDDWRGRHVVTLGREAFLWFGIDQPEPVRDALEAFWKDEDRFQRHVEVPLRTEAGHQRRFVLYPLPHPSPLNQAWFKRFPALLEARLRELSV